MVRPLTEGPSVLASHHYVVSWYFLSVVAFQVACLATLSDRNPGTSSIKITRAPQMFAAASCKGYIFVCPCSNPSFPEMTCQVKGTACKT